MGLRVGRDEGVRGQEAKARGNRSGEASPVSEATPKRQAGRGHAPRERSDASLWAPDGTLLASRATGFKVQSDEGTSSPPRGGTGRRASVKPVRAFGDFLSRNEAADARKARLQGRGPGPEPEPGRGRKFDDPGFADFLGRQDQAAGRRRQEPEAARAVSFMSSRSKRLLNRRRERRDPRADAGPEFSFKPDTSLTLRRDVVGLSVKHAEARLVLRAIDMKALKLEIRGNEMQECTFAPFLESDAGIRRRAVKHAAERRRRSSQAARPP